MPRIAVIHKDRCNPVGCGGYLCIRVCPVNMVGKECIVVGSDKKPRIDELLCTGCGICPNRCPFGAIDIINLPEQLTKPPIHRYGRNGFHLYNLPTPMFGSVVGILGRNGIGKSTAVKILAGMLKPNLGRDEASYDDLLKFFKGSEAQVFFEKLKKQEVIVSFKPQAVDLIPSSVKGRVRDLLKSVDEKGIFSSVVDRLQLGEVLDNSVSEVSGGELQRIAIAAAAMKKANLYIFDEPTSYLDVKQRMVVSDFIRSLCDDKTAVLVVEHDLLILDLLADYVCVMYGKEGCYGVVSSVKASRVGMNSFLQGFLKEENMRFRDYSIAFHPKGYGGDKKKVILTSWSDVHKKLGHFSFTSKEGSLYCGEVVGVLGENGIGKTTFMKILAHVVKPDKGEVDAKVTVSYKPQYLESVDVPVASLLQEAMQKCSVQFRPLNLAPLLTKNVSELSGGELQRVAIAQALARDADVYLLDEPSAYLDVEQRLAVSKVIKDLTFQRDSPIVVVDHDLLFVNYVSDRVLVFTGEPAKSGESTGPHKLEDGMNMFLEILGVTVRRDAETNRPRINKANSRLDREQRAKGIYYA